MSASPAVNDFYAAVSGAVLRRVRRLIARLERPLARSFDARAVRHDRPNLIRHMQRPRTRQLVVVLEAEIAQRLIVRVPDDQNATGNAVERPADVVNQALVARV